MAFDFGIKNIGIAIGQEITKTASTLYEAATEIKSMLDPDMVINLDMGAYNYCQVYTELGPKACGELLTKSENLTNLITIQLIEKN